MGDKLLSPLDYIQAAGLHNLVYRCTGTCSEWKGEGLRPQDHGKFVVETDGTVGGPPLAVYCPACNAPAVQQTASRTKSAGDQYEDMSAMSNRAGELSDQMDGAALRPPPSKTMVYPVRTDSPEDRYNGP